MKLSKRGALGIAALALAMGAAASLPWATLRAQTVTPVMTAPAEQPGRLANLHDLLGITPTQEPQWKALAAVIRENVRERRAARLALAGQHADALGRLRALHDEMLPAREKALERFIDAFRPLYESFSPEQKRAADALSAMLFRRA